MESYNVPNNATENVEETYRNLMDGYNYVHYDDCNEYLTDGYYHQLSAPGYNEMGSADIIAQTI